MTEQIQQKSRLIKDRIMDRMRFTIITIFTVLGLIGFFVVMINANRSYGQVQNLTLANISQRLTEQIDGIFSDARIVSTSEPAQSFATALGSSEATAEDIRQTRTALMNTLADLLTDGRGRYVAARYIDADGSVQVEATLTGENEIRTDLNVDFRARAPGTDPSLQQGLGLEFGSAAISNLTVAPGLATDTPRPLVTVVTPVTRAGDLSGAAGIIEIEADATAILGTVSNVVPDSTLAGQSRRYVLLDRNGFVLADNTRPVGSYLPDLAADAPSYPQADAALFSLLTQNAPQFDTQLRTGLGQSVSLVASEAIIRGNAPTMPWQLVVVDRGLVVFSQPLITGGIVFVSSVLVAFGLVFVINRQLTRNLRRVTVANEMIQQIQRGQHIVTAPVDVYLNDADEDTLMITATQQVAQQLASLNAQIEEQAQRYQRNLRVAAQVGRETAAVEDINQLLDRAINLISTAFSIYHAQVFLLDNTKENAVLIYSQGEVGQRLLEQRHQLAVGSRSVIGQVTASGEAVIVNDTQQDADQRGTHAFNPLLKDTRAEMALPLRIGQGTIGALDLQSNKPNIFQEEDLQTYQLLADQIAVAVYKTQLVQQSQQRVRQIESLNRQLTQMAWEELEREVGLEQVYRYDLLNVEAGSADQVRTMTTAEMLSYPIRIRNEVIGTLNATPPQGMRFTNNDEFVMQSVANRIALAVENARLFQETQTNLAETSTLYQTSRFLNEANTMEDIIQAIVQSAMPQATSGQVGIFDPFDDDGHGRPAWMEITNAWQQSGEPLPEGIVGKRFSMQHHPLLKAFNANQVVLVRDVDRDVRVDPTLREWFQRVDGHAVVLIPLSVRGNWRGCILIEFPEPRNFPDREGRTYNNIIDQAGVAVDNRLLLDQTQRTLVQNERLYQASALINQAQGLDDLVRATQETAGNRDMNFGLLILEGPLDETGWPTCLRHVAQSHGVQITKPNTVIPITLSPDSPLRDQLSEWVIRTDPANAFQRQLADLLATIDDQCGIVFPVQSGKQIVALFMVSSARDTIFLSDEEDTYRTLAGQMGTVIQNRRLLEQTEQALDETSRLYRASNAITVAQDTTAMYQAAVDHLTEPFDGVTRVTVLTAHPEPAYDPAYLEAAFVWEDGLVTTTPMRFGNQTAPYSRLTDTLGEETRLDAVQKRLTDYVQLREFIQANGTRSLMTCNLESRQNWLGLLMIESRHADMLPQSYVRFARALADQVAIALDNQLLFEQAQQEARQALALAEASQLANQIGGELTGSINTLFARLAETAGYDRWALAQLDEANNQLVPISQYVPAGVPAIMPEALNLSTAEHTLSDAVLVNRTIMVNNPQTHPSLKHNPDVVASVGKHISTPIVIGERIIGAMIIGRAPTSPDLTERDDTLIDTLAAQVAVTMDNQRLFIAAENERNTLRSILNTLPAGVLVLDARTLLPVQYNNQVPEYLGRSIDEHTAFNSELYSLYRTGTNVLFPDDELPILASLQTGQSEFSDEVSVVRDDGHQIDLLINAAPIRNANGEIVSIVAAFEDISNLRNLEGTLQDNLRETISLYEATRSLSEADELDDVLDVVLFQLIMNEPEDAQLILMDDPTNTYRVIRSMSQQLDIVGLSDGVLNPERIVLIDNIYDDVTITEADRQHLIEQQVGAFASVPLRASKRDTPLGWIVVNYTEPHEFSPEDERFLSTLGDNAAVAIDNRYLFRRTQRALSETSSLYSATTTISRVRDINELTQVVQTAAETLQPDIYAAYLMTDPSSPDLLDELFNVNMDGPPVDFSVMLTRFGLFRDERIFIDDLLAIEEPNPFEQALIDLGHIQAFASVSLRVKGMPDGRMFLAYREPHTFVEGDIRYLNAVADSTSVVIDNIILLEQIQNALEETSTLYQASRSLADASTPEDILEVVHEKLIGPHINQVFVALLSTTDWNAEEATVQIMANWQSDPSLDLDGIALTADQFPAWNLLATKSVITIDDVQTESSLSDIERMAVASLDALALDIIPLRVPTRSIGAIWISSREPHRHSEREKRVYQAFAEQASLSLEASFLLEQTERRARQLATSAEVTQIAGSILDLDVLLPKVVELIKAQFGYDHVQVFLMDDNYEFALLKASTGEPGRELLAIGHKLEKGSRSVIGQVTLREEPVIALDTSDARVIHRPNPYLPLTRSEMALPIMIKGELIGALDVQSNTANAFGDDDVAVLTLLAGQISVAIDNARLFNESERRADEMSFLFTITTAAASADGLEESLQNVAELLRGSREALSVGVYLTSEEVAVEERNLNIVAMSSDDLADDIAHSVSVTDTENLIALVADDLIPVIIDDIRDEPRYHPLCHGARSAVLVPLSSGGEVIGLVTMEADRLRAYNQDTLTLLLALGGTLAAIVQNARLIADISQKNEELLTLDRIKSDFLANMSHELRTPLNSIIGFSRVMLKGIDGELTEMQEQDLTTIFNSGQHLLGLINDVLDTAKIAADKMDLQQEYFEIKNVIEGVRSIGIGLVKERPVEILVNTANNMPQAFGDEFRTRQVLLNIVSNAAKFTSEGSITLNVYPVEVENVGKMIRVDVTDTGIGIAEKDLPLLFEAFRQIDSSLTRTAGGTGLGLPIAKSLIELQGGEMFVQSEVNVGSTFSITVPTYPVVAFGDDEDDQPKAQTAPQANGKHADAETSETATVEMASLVVQNQGNQQKLMGPPPSVFERKRQILIIEESTQRVDQYRRLLQREGFEVQVASDTFFATTMASGLRPTLIIMDVNFADGEGWNILKEIKDRDDTFDIPVIVVTLDGDSERAYREGAYDFIQLPYTPDQLVEATLAAERESNIDRILIIDDQPESTRLIEQILEAHGRYRVFAAHTGPEGISLVARRRPDLVILDLRMPGMDGFAVLDELRSRPETASIPLVVVTGETTMSHDEREKLINLEIIYKTDLNQENYQTFIDEVRRQIAKYHGE
jgi:GAF domain-containing protein/DNA-binding response OmpR family regulator